jgi:polyhydroxyalkanoate synthesis regulator phasin
MDLNNALKNFLTTTATEYIECTKERDRLVKEEEEAYQKAEHISYLLSEHRKKFNALEKKLEMELNNLVEASTTTTNSDMTRKCSEFEQYKSFRRN